MRICVVAVAAVLIAAGVAAGIPGAEDKSPKKPAEAEEKPAGVMKNKLLHSHRLLKSLAQEDFDALEDSAQKLQKIAREQWIKKPSPRYRAQLQVFWTTLAGIETGARAEDIEEATLAYMQMTLACVRCHKVIRREQKLK